MGLISAILQSQRPQVASYTNKAPLEDLEGLVRQYLAGGGNGNIDLTTRPMVKNPDGSTSTVRTGTFGIDGQQYLLPTVGEDGQNLDPDAAVTAFMNTGKYLGKYSTPQEAEAAAQRLHNMQAQYYGLEPPNFDNTLEAINQAFAAVSPAAGKMRKPERNTGFLDPYNLIRHKQIYYNEW
jgi:hypothetical protein